MKTSTNLFARRLAATALAIAVPIAPVAVVTLSAAPAQAIVVGPVTANVYFAVPGDWITFRYQPQGSHTTNMVRGGGLTSVHGEHVGDGIWQYRVQVDASDIGQEFRLEVTTSFDPVSSQNVVVSARQASLKIDRVDNETPEVGKALTVFGNLSQGLPKLIWSAVPADSVVPHIETGAGETTLAAIPDSWAGRRVQVEAVTTEAGWRGTATYVTSGEVLGVPEPVDPPVDPPVEPPIEPPVDEPVKKPVAKKVVISAPKKVKSGKRIIVTAKNVTKGARLVVKGNHSKRKVTVRAAKAGTVKASVPALKLKKGQKSKRVKVTATVGKVKRTFTITVTR